MLIHTQSDIGFYKRNAYNGGRSKGRRPPFFNEIQMKLSEFSERLGTFYNGDDRDNKDISSLEGLLDGVSSFFLNQYNEIDDSEFVSVKYMSHLKLKERKNKLNIELKNLFSDINKLITKACKPGNFNGIKEFYEFFFNNKGELMNKHYITTIPIGKHFYRMRGSQNYEVYNRMGLFVIPDNIIHLVGKQRFNKDGIPCLYLGESLYCAWEEVRRKDFNQVNFACFKNTRNLTVLDLTIKPIIRRKEDFILAYFALLVSGKVVDSNAYKFQYEVSNLVMEVIQANIAKNGKVDGIKYLSSRRYDGTELHLADVNRMYGYVFPPKEGDKVEFEKKNLDKWLYQSFKLTEPRTMFMYDIHCIDFNRTRTAITRLYQDTLFYKLEELLKKEKFDYCNK